MQPGDLIQIEWFDASIGKSGFGSGCSIDVPVQSWGIFIGILGNKTKHIVLAQNSFCMSDGCFDLDYTAVPLGMAINITILSKQHIEKEAASKLVMSFLSNRRYSMSKMKSPRTFQHRTFQHRLSIDGRPD